VQEQSVWRYIGFGTTLRYLQDARQGWRIHGDIQVLSNLKRFFDHLDEFGLAVTRNVANAELLPELMAELDNSNHSAVLTATQAEDLRKRMTTVRKTLAAEARELKAFVTSSKRWDVERLLHSPGEMFGQDVYSKLDAQAAFDFEEACKCIAFERSTAAAFHIMRGTEAVLRSFYCHIIKQSRLAKEQRMWKAMLDKLRARSKPPPKALLDNLDAIRYNFRNPTQHPDEIYTIDRAQDLLGLVIPAINEMVSLIEN
jgi:hypothetical protein